LFAARGADRVHRLHCREQVVAAGPERAVHLLVGLPLDELAGGDLGEQLADGLTERER